MREFVHARKLAIVILLFGVVWLISCLCFADFSLMLPNYMIGILFGLVAFVIVDVYLLVFRKAATHSTTEVNAVPLIVSLVYLIASVMFNTNCIFRGYTIPGRFVIIGNCVAIAVYIAVLVYTCDNSNRVSKTIEASQEKIRVTNDLSKKLSMVLNHAKDEEVRSMLLKLKENVDYSSNLSQNCTVEYEKQFDGELDQINQLLSDADNLDSVKDKIRKAEKIWMDRNSVANTKR